MRLLRLGRLLPLIWSSDKLSWRIKDVINMIQLAVSDNIAVKFMKTKKRHLDIWNDVKLRRLC